MTPTPVRVLINAVHARSGGGLTYLNNMLPRLAMDTRLAVTILIHRDQRGYFEIPEQRMTVEEVNYAPGFIRQLLWEQIRLPTLVRRLKCQVTFSPANFGPLFAPRSVILLRNALAVGAVEKRLAKKIYWAALGMMTKFSAICATEIMAVSAYARDAITRGSKMQRNRTHIVHHGISDTFRPDGSIERNQSILAVGDIYIQKNFHRLVEAYAKLATGNTGWSLTIAGATIDVDYKNRLDTLIAGYGLQNRIHFTGRVNQETLIRLYRECGLFVFPSTAETFGQPLVEAMACGAPVLSSNTTAMPEIAGDAALFCDPENVGDIHSGLNQLIKNEELRQDLSRRAIARAAEFSWDRTAKQTADVLVRAAD